MAPFHRDPYGLWYVYGSTVVSSYIRLCHKQLSSVIYYVASCRLKHCSAVRYVLFSLAFLVSGLLLCTKAFEFGSLDIQPKGQVVPYHPTYQLMHFNGPDSISYSRQKSKAAGMNHKTNRHIPTLLASSTSPTGDLSSPPFVSEPLPVKITSTSSEANRHRASRNSSQSVTPLGALLASASTYHLDQYSIRRARMDKSADSSKSKSVTRSVDNLLQLGSRPSHLISDTSSAIEKADYGGSQFDSLFASPSFNASLGLGINLEKAQSIPVSYDSVYLGFDSSSDVSGSSKRDDFSTIDGFDGNVENYDLFDYPSEEEEVLDSNEHGDLAKGNVNANRFVTVDYASNENGPMLHSWYSSENDPVLNMYQSRATATVMKPSPRQARYVFHSDRLNITWPVKKVSEVQGNITLGGLMMVHEREDKKICGPIMPQGGIQALEAMLHTIDYVNSRNDILPGVTLGAYILDDCDKDTYGLEQSIDFIKGSITNIDEDYQCSDGSPRAHKKTWGVLGAASSATSIQVANLLRLFRIPQVSFFSTSSELSNKQRFEYFLRTVPSDKSQAEAIVEIVKRLKWSYVSIIYEESIYGIRAFNDLEELLDQNDICIAIKERLSKDSGIAADSSYDNIVKKLTTKPNSKGVIVFGSDQEVALLMRAVKRNNATGQFYWIGSDGWSARSIVFQGNERQVEGTISVQPMANPVPGFDEYFLGLTPHNNKRNPWFIEYWEQYFQCKWPDSDYTPYNLHFSRNCSGEERMTAQNGYEVEGQLQFVSDAVLAFAYAIESMQKELCPGVHGVCPRMLTADGSELLQHLKTVQFKAIDGHEFYFAKNTSDGPARYRIIHYKQFSEKSFDWVQVGEYVEDTLNLDLDKVQFRHSDPEVPVSVCSQPCEKGQAKSFLEGEKCCFHCINCTKYQVLVSETQCFDCPSGFLPNAQQSECVPIPEEFMRPDSTWSIGALLFSGIGIIVTIFVIFIFIKYNDTPVVRASGRELCYVLLAGILMCYSMTFILVQRPTAMICGAQKAGIGLCFSVVYSAILTKTNRISRIFKAGKKSARRPSFISPKSQLLICGAFVMIQFFIVVVWLALSPPRVIHYHPTREDNKLICQASINAGYFVAFIYPIFLIVVCTVYAVLTRNIPEAFNESKFIGFTMYTTCIIWLAFVPIYFTSSQSNHISLNITTLSVSISLSATVTLLCLFSPKLYIILLHPEKNVRQSMMPQHKYSTVVAGRDHESPGQNAVIRVTTCIQTNNRVDSATQSDEYEMSEVMVITGSNKATFEGRSSNLSEIVSASNGVHSRNGSFKGNNGFKCRCMTLGDTGPSNEVCVTEAETITSRELRKESKSTQTVLSTVNGINGGLPSRGIDFLAYNETENALANH